MQAEETVLPFDSHMSLTDLLVEPGLVEREFRHLLRAIVQDSRMSYEKS